MWAPEYVFVAGTFRLEEGNEVHLIHHSHEDLESDFFNTQQSEGHLGGVY
jgi:hypothetical protein